MNSTSSRTSSKKRMLYGSDSERSKRLNANLIERRRMQNINCGFSSLKKLLPPSDRKQTKAAILQQASQHILRLQRAIIQFKAENDTLRNAFKLKRLSHGRLNCTGKPIETKMKQSEYPCGMDGNYPTLTTNSLPNKENASRMFEHVKKFKPTESGSFGHQMYHGIDSMPLTPPVSPLFEDHVLRRGGNVMSETSTSLAPMPSMTCRRNRACLYSLDKCHDFHSPKKSFTPMTNVPPSPEHTLGEKHTTASPVRCFTSEDQFFSAREKRQGRKRTMESGRQVDENSNNAGDKQPQGDLQSIIDAIHIIESSGKLENL